MKKHLPEILGDHLSSLKEVENQLTLQEWKKIAEKRLLYLRQIIDLYHSYGHDNDLFIKHFKEIVNIEQIRKSCIIDFCVLVQIINENDICLCKTEIELICLLNNGFKARELRVILGHNNFDSIYIKINRIKRKLVKTGSN